MRNKLNIISGWTAALGSAIIFSIFLWWIVLMVIEECQRGHSLTVFAISVVVITFISIAVYVLSSNNTDGGGW